MFLDGEMRMRKRWMRGEDGERSWMRSESLMTMDLSTGRVRGDSMEMSMERS